MSFLSRKKEGIRRPFSGWSSKHSSEFWITSHYVEQDEVSEVDVKTAQILGQTFSSRDRAVLAVVALFDESLRVESIDESVCILGKHELQAAHLQ